MQRNGIYLAALAVVIAFGVARIASTHRVFSEVLDEPVHILAGYEWLTGRPYASDPEHPPLERALSALPALMQHASMSEETSPVARGNALLYFHDDYRHNLAAARRGNLLFFIAGAIGVAIWAQRKFGRIVALIATAFFTYLPPVLGHAGVATTDMGATATITLAIVALEWWLDSPNAKRAALLGAAVGLGLITKFTFLLFFPIAAVIVFLLRRRGAAAPLSTKARSLAVIALVAVFVIWAGYRFEFGTIKSVDPHGDWLAAEAAPKIVKPLASWFAAHVPIPAPRFALGVVLVQVHNRGGHLAYLLGKTSQHGWWYYFPVVFFYKTPLPLLILMLIGLVLAVRRAPAVALIPIAMMLAVLPSSINIGVRHILPIYPPLCIAAACAVFALWRYVSMRAIVVLLVAWLCIGVERAHPDYLAWFNEAAGDHPEHIASDSNLDWGQDVLRLARVVRDRNIGPISILYTGNALLERHELHAEEIRPWSPAPGWYVLSETALVFRPEARQGAYRWLDAYRFERIGKSMRLIHVPELPPSAP